MILLLVLVACGPGAEEFPTLWAEASCTWYADCAVLDVVGYADADACVAELGPQRVCGEAFDPAAASACLDAIAVAGCDGVADPAECQGVCMP